jgi:hypothetical protein
MEKEMKKIELHIEHELGGRRVRLSLQEEEEPDWKIGDTLMTLGLQKGNKKRSTIIIVDEKYTINEYQKMVDSIELPEDITLNGVGFYKMTSKRFDGSGLIYSITNEED